MYLVVIAWMYVTLMMAVAEAASPQGSILGALITFSLYGLLPLGLVVYVMGAPARSRAIKAAEQQERESAKAETPTADRSHIAPDTSGEPAASAEDGRVAPVRKEP
jgi:hypothetical protein